MRRMCLSIVLLATLCMGCADLATNQDGLGESNHALTENGPEALGLLAFLNHPETTVDLLDHKVPLNRRTARNLMHHRNGWDQVFGTYDDNLFTSVKEVDSVRWVGPTAMARLIDFVISEGWVAQDDDILGVYDGVSFTVKEAELTLAFVNQASHGLLDDGLSLDRRGADSIVAAQPIDSMETLADLYYVGSDALKRLKAAALGNDPVALGQTDSTIVGSAHDWNIKVRFAHDLAIALAKWYEFYGEDAMGMGSNSHPVAQGSITIQEMTKVMDANDDPYGHDPSKILVLRHPDVIFPGGELVWFGAYDRASLKLIEVYTFE